MYKCVFFDLDDTIWDFHTNAYFSLQEVFEEKRLSRYFDNFELFFRIYAQKNVELWEAYGKNEISKEFLQKERFRYPLAQMGVDDESLSEGARMRYMEILPTKSALLPHAEELLIYLSEKYTLTIISNGFVEIQNKKLNNCGIGKYFSHIVFSDMIGVLKPDKRIFEYALNLNNASAHQAVMIGDSYEADIKGAKNAGIDQIYFPLKKQPDMQDATYRISSLKDVFDIL